MDPSRIVVCRRKVILFAHVHVSLPHQGKLNLFSICIFRVSEQTKNHHLMRFPSLVKFISLDGNKGEIGGWDDRFEKHITHGGVVSKPGRKWSVMADVDAVVAITATNVRFLVGVGVGVKEPDSLFVEWFGVNLRVGKDVDGRDGEVYEHDIPPDPIMQCLDQGAADVVLSVLLEDTHAAESVLQGRGVRSRSWRGCIACCGSRDTVSTDSAYGLEGGPEGQEEVGGCFLHAAEDEKAESRSTIVDSSRWDILVQLGFEGKTLFVMKYCNADVEAVLNGICAWWQGWCGVGLRLRGQRYVHVRRKWRRRDDENVIWWWSGHGGES